MTRGEIGEIARLGGLNLLKGFERGDQQLNQVMAGIEIFRVKSGARF